MNKYLQLLRRRFYLNFRKKYVQESLKKRKGKCNRCSCCEPILFFGKRYNCKHYDKKDKGCRLYNTCRMPYTCKDYPFDEKDKWDEFRERCGFYWEKGK